MAIEKMLAICPVQSPAAGSVTPSTCVSGS